MPAASYDFSASASYNDEAKSLLAGAVNSNVRLAGPPFPLCFERAEGAHLFDIDGNGYIDYALGMGPDILGHAPKQVCDAVAKSLSQGQMFAGQHRAELKLAKLLSRHIPSAEMVRIGMTGSEAVHAALRLARAHTGRTKFIKFEGQYHGWFDSVLVSYAPNVAEPDEALPLPRTPKLESEGQLASACDDIIVLPWNDAGALEQVIDTHGHEIAAVITEPALCNTGSIAPRPGYLERMRDLTEKRGIVLIFDEVITGFRLAVGGAQARFGITPDLSTFAKAMAGGFPIAALVGKRELMEKLGTGAVNHSGTYNANVPSIVASIATVEALAANDGAALVRAEATGNALMSGLQDLAASTGSNLKVQGYGTCFNTFFSDEDVVVDYQSYKRTDLARQQAFLAALVLRGVRPTNRGTWFVSTAHGDTEVHETLAIAEEALTSLT
ncbi:MAG: aspartate aminotransferase family protein [Pseudomonadota bacterium]